MPVFQEDPHPKAKVIPYNKNLDIMFPQIQDNWVSGVFNPTLNVLDTFNYIASELSETDPQVQQENSKQLLYLLWYLYLGPVMAVSQKARTYIVQAVFPQAEFPPNSHTSLKDKMELLFNSLFQIELTLARDDFEVADQRVSGMTLDTFQMVSAVGPVELLVRILAEGSINLDSLVSQLQLSHLSQLEKVEGNLIPGVIFICEGPKSNESTTMPTFVVSASKVTRWGRFKVMSDWFYKNRNARAIDFPVPAGVKNVLENQINVFESDCEAALEEHVKSWKERNPKKWMRKSHKRSEGKITTRKNAIEEYSTGNKKDLSYDHLSETGIPLKLPKFNPFARCVKCRAMFRYTVPETVEKLEEEDTSLLDDFQGDWNSCAEVLGHLYCSLANENGKHTGVPIPS